VSDREIRRAVRAGACCAREIADACGAGSVCGGCRASVAAILAETAPPPSDLTFVRLHESGWPTGRFELSRSRG
jgi:bacterioferritin-associated ferredoxin